MVYSILLSNTPIQSQMAAIALACLAMSTTGYAYALFAFGGCTMLNHWNAVTSQLGQ
ncbi:MAG: hypothetical protein V7K26_02865 [Nostoc sp.]|uniref:hypothetical protein n=1 Tax=Nostoc sp. TaxID=1180 RepID=UPI002FF2D7CD